MLLKQNRLTKKRDIEIAFENGRFVGGALTTMKVWHISTEKYPKRGYNKEMLKIGFVVGKKVHKSAVKRNRVKRQMREVVRLLLKDNTIRVGSMIIFMAKSSILEASYGDIEKDIKALLKKAKLMR
jgi:ribonuclease P protein component